MDQNAARKKGRVLKSIIIEPFRQFKFGVYVIGICLAFIGAAGYLFVNSFIEQYKHVLGLFNVVDPSAKWSFIIDDIFYSNLIKLSICFALFLIIMFYTVFKLTHRYYGPLVSILRFLKELQAGNYTARIKLRKKDELQELADNLNLLAETLQKKYPPTN